MDDPAARDAYRRAVEESARRELLYAIPILEVFEQVARALEVTSRNLVGAAEIEHERKTNAPQRRPYRFRLTPQRELPEDEDHDARVIDHSASKALNAIAVVMERSLEAALFVLESEHPQQRKYAAQLLVDQLNSTIERLLLLSTLPTMGAIRSVAAKRTEFPSLMSLSQKINNDREDLIRRHLKLGRNLPFRVDPRTAYTAYTRLAMQVVSYIDVDRRRKNSIYRKVLPAFHTKDFSEKHWPQWERVIKFHLDFFQSPQPRRRRFLMQQDTSVLQHAMESRLAKEDRTNFIRPWSLSPFGEITEMLEFKYRQGKPVKMSAGILYNQVKFKVVDAALALLPK